MQESVYTLMAREDRKGHVSDDGEQMCAPSETAGNFAGKEESGKEEGRRLF